MKFKLLKAKKTVSIPFLKEEKRILERLYPNEDPDDKLTEMIRQNGKLMGGVLIACVILGAAYFLSFHSQKGNLYQPFKVLRPSYGEAAREVLLTVYGKDIGSFPVAIKVSPKKYEKEEIEPAFSEARSYVRKHFLGENKDEKHIETKLVFMTGIPNSLIRVSWILDEEGILLKDGSINSEFFGEDEKEVTIAAVLTYEDRKEEMEMVLQVIPEKLTEKQAFLKKYYQNLEESEKGSIEHKALPLPQTVDGKPVFYKEVRKNYGPVFAILGLVGIILAPLQMRQKLKANEKERRKQLTLDYPNLVNKFVLLLGAGMTVGGAFERIALRYQREKSSADQQRYVYEEMLYTLKQIKNGAAEGRAYEQFGRRLEQASYLKFSTLISQNLRKGGGRIMELLEMEALEAYEKRKEYAKKQGEEVSTKLLLPMILMMILVMVLIMAPAFMAF